MKTTLELPDELFRSANARAAQEGIGCIQIVAIDTFNMGPTQRWIGNGDA
jgi:hypothetical protein